MSSINGGTWSRLSSLLLNCSLALDSISISRLPTRHFMVVSEGMMKDIRKDHLSLSQPDLLYYGFKAYMLALAYALDDLSIRSLLPMHSK